MPKIVLDASVVLAWLEQGEKSDAANMLRHDIVGGTVAAWAPDFLLTEFINLFRKKHLSRSDAKLFIETVLTVGISFDDAPVRTNIAALIDITTTHKISAYDAQYLLLAQKLNCKLVSFDRELLRIKDLVVSPS